MCERVGTKKSERRRGKLGKGFWVGENEKKEGRDGKRLCVCVGTWARLNSFVGTFEFICVRVFIRV